MNKKSIGHKKYPNFKLEKELYNIGYDYIIGVDEVNVFSLTSHIPACAIVMNRHKRPIYGVTDSKLLTRRQRELLYNKITKNAKTIGRGQCSVDEINKIGIYQGHIVAKKRAIENALRIIGADQKLNICIIVDGNFDLGYKKFSQLSISHADERIYPVACASIVAKVEYDRYMYEMDLKYPGYGFAKNTGCPTKEHYKAIYEKGLTPIHRVEFCKKFPQLEKFFIGGTDEVQNKISGDD